MENIKKVQPFKTSSVQNNIGILTTLLADVAVSAMDAIAFEQKSLLASYIYESGGAGYNLHYTVVDTNGETESYMENGGILPTLFLSPENENYVSVVFYDPDKEQEISIPVFNRESTVLPKKNRPFTGEFMGIFNQFSIFYNVDVWPNIKPDKLLAIEFKDGIIKKKHNAKVALPKKNKIFIANNEIHLLAKDGRYWLHRQIDEKGVEIKRREIVSDRNYFREILSLSFSGNSYLLTQDNGKIVIDEIDINGNSKAIDVLDFEDTFYNTWRPVQISERAYVIRFNTEFGNGWFTLRDHKLTEFFYGKGVRGYKNLISGAILEMKDDRLIISSINKTTEGAYAVVFYPKEEKDKKNNKLIVLNRNATLI